MTKLIMGQSPSSDDCNQDGVGFPFLQGNAEFGRYNPIPKTYCVKVNKIVPRGSILISVRAPVGELNIADQDYAIGRGLCSIQTNKMVHRYLYYLLQLSRTELKSVSTGSTYDAVTIEDVKEMYLLCPSEQEQHCIANFLDKETSKIDNLIEKKQRLIELLQEKRQALITNAVTKGLDPSVPMKDSGIPWLGEVPEHWDVKKLKYIARMVGGSTPFKDNLEFWNGDIPWVSPKDMKADFIHTSKDYITHLGVIDNNLELVPENSTLIVVRSGILKHTLPVAMTKIKVTLNQDMKALIPKSNFLISEYLFWMFKGLAKSVLNNSWKIGATVDSIEIELLENLFFPIPSREEQQTIINYLESRTLKINKLISKLQTQITKLQEYRQALITAAVTGKIDVREKVSS